MKRQHCWAKHAKTPLEVELISDEELDQRLISGLPLCEPRQELTLLCEKRSPRPKRSEARSEGLLRGNPHLKDSASHLVVLIGGLMVRGRSICHLQEPGLQIPTQSKPIQACLKHGRGRSTLLFMQKWFNETPHYGDSHGERCPMAGCDL